jgi:hypothetical protein
MSTSSPSPRWQPTPSSSIVEALYEDEDIEDIVALSGAAAPEWIQHSSVPMNWQLVRLPDASDQMTARMAVCGPLGNGEWEAADTISVIGFTGWLAFYDVFRNADRMLRDLDATDIAVKVLPVPPIQWTAAVRSSGVATIDDQSVWVQQSNYVAGSEQSRAGRLIVHSLFVDSAFHDRLTEDIAQLSDDVYQGFINALSREHHAR